MAITFVGGQTATITAVKPSTQAITFSLTGGSDVTPSSGDLVLISYSIGTPSDLDFSARVSTSGYTLITELFSSDSDAINMAVYKKIMGATPDSSVAVVGTESSTVGCAVNIRVFRGVSSTNPLDITTATATGIDTGDVNPPAVTPITANNVIVVFGATGIGGTPRTYTTSSTAYLSNFTQRTASGSSFSCITGSGYLTGQPSGISYDPSIWAASLANTAYSWAAATIVLRPESSSAPYTADVPLLDTSLASLVPSVYVETLVNTATSSIYLLGNSPNIFAGASVNLDSKFLVLESFVPSLSALLELNVLTTSINLEGLVPSILSGVSLSAQTLWLNPQSFPPDIFSGVGLFAESKGFTTYASVPKILLSSAIFVGSANLICTVATPTLDFNEGLLVPVTFISLSPKSVNIFSGKTFSVPLKMSQIDSKVPFVLTFNRDYSRVRTLVMLAENRNLLIADFKRVTKQAPVSENRIVRI